MSVQGCKDFYRINCCADNSLAAAEEAPIMCEYYVSDVFCAMLILILRCRPVFPPTVCHADSADVLGV